MNKIEINDELLKKVNGGVITPEMRDVVNKLAANIDAKYQEWLKANPTVK